MANGSERHEKNGIGKAMGKTQDDWQHTSFGGAIHWKAQGDKWIEDNF